MKKLFIIVEGQTEAEFIKYSLLPYLGEKHGIWAVIPVIMNTSRTSKGGALNLDRLKENARNILNKESNIVLTTFFDFFRLHSSFYEGSDCNSKSSSDEIIACLEQHLATQINDRRFIPYLQKHEFEALLFSNNTGFIAYTEECISLKTAAIIAQYSNPEDINNAPETAPSKRLETLFKACGQKYEKVVDGNLIALEIGIENILQSCPRFRQWVECLIRNLSAIT